MADSKELENVLDLYEDLARVPMPLRSRINLQNDARFVTVTSSWSERSMPLKKKLTRTKSAVVQLDGTDRLPTQAFGETLMSGFGIDNGQSFCNRKDTREVTLLKTGEGKEKKEFFVCHDKTRDVNICTVDLTAAKKHGKVVAHGEFGGPQWSNGEGHIVYLAERQLTTPAYFDPDLDLTDETKLAQNPPGLKYSWRQNWGEQLYEVVDPVICVLDVQSGNITVIEDIPANVCPAYVTWDPEDEGFVFVGLESELKLGKIYCFNRASTLYYYHLQSACLTPLGEPGVALCGFRFSPDGKKLVFLQRNAGWTHDGCAKLQMLDWESKVLSTVIDIVNVPEGEPDGFPGFYNRLWGLPQRCWTKDNKRVLFTSIWRSKAEIVLVNIEEGTVKKITNVGAVHGSWSVHDVHDDLVLAVCHAPNRAPRLLIGRVPGVGKEGYIVWQRVSKDRIDNRVTDTIEWKTLAFRRSEREGEEDYVDSQYECIYVCPKEGTSCPLISFPHGGPHSCYVAGFSAIVSFFVNMGYAVLLINYRGSTGFGDQFVSCLPGKVGTLDVLDCQHAVETVLAMDDRLDESKVYVFGGSHGGFLGAHLVAQFPNFYKASALLNPVLSFADELSASDIPDWNVVESLAIEFDPSRSLTPEERNKMWDVSPMSLVENIQTPVLLCIGAKDLRVVPFYKPFWRNLKARGVTCEVALYPESNHPLEELEVDSDMLINTVQFFEKHT